MSWTAGATGPRVRRATPDDAAVVLALIHGAFADRPTLDPPATAMEETQESVRAALEEHGGLLVEVDGRPAGTLLFDPVPAALLGLRRVGVSSDVRGHGVAALLVDAALRASREGGFAGTSIEARAELPRTIAFWRRNGYHTVARSGPRLIMVRLLPLGTVLAHAEDTRRVGERLGALLGAGDLVLLTGELGAGKTTLTQGIGAGLGVRGPVTSPTFVIARVHPALDGGPDLVHVDAYRLGGSTELDDLDLDTALDEAVTVVEWGEGMAEVLATDRLEVRLERSLMLPADDPALHRPSRLGHAPSGSATVRATVTLEHPAPDSRRLMLTPVGTRWATAAALRSLMDALDVPA